MDEIIAIDIKTIKQHGLFFFEFAYLLNFVYYEKMTEAFKAERLIKKGLIIKSADGYFTITDKGIDVLNSITSAGKTKNIDDELISDLIEQLISRFPKGQKPGTSKYWRGNRSEVKKKLSGFIQKYKIEDFDLILAATERYVASFNGDKQLMRILPYFIEKDGESDLLTTLENIDSEPIVAPGVDWTSYLV